MRIDVYSHGYTVRGLTNATRVGVGKLCRFLGHFELQPTETGRYEQKQTATYAGGFANREQFCFHKDTLERFLRIMADIVPGIKPEIVHHDLWDSVDVKIELKDLREPRWGQPGAIEHGLSEGNIKAICLGPGRGKTFVFNRISFAKQKRVAMILRSGYVDKWEKDIGSAHHCEEGDILKIKGGKDLMKLMLAALTGTITAKYILISNSTYRNYLKLWEMANGDLKDQGYPLSPFELMGALGVEILGIDEVHQDFHFNHRCIIHQNVPLIVTLSGTLDPDNSFKNDITKLTFPASTRYIEPPPPPYIRCKALQFSLQSPHLIKWKHRGRSEYSQAAFEKSIMHYGKVLTKYKEMILDIAAISFMPLWKPGRKLLVFAGTKKMCTILAEAFAKKYPDLKVRRYIGEDPYSHIGEADILVSTTKSCGTAIDIPGLAISLMTEAVNDTQANLQHIKRLREPDQGPDYFTPEFLYLLCSNIPQHMNYHKHKVEIFRSEVISHETLLTDYVI